MEGLPREECLPSLGTLTFALVLEVLSYSMFREHLKVKYSINQVFQVITPFNSWLLTHYARTIELQLIEYTGKKW